MKRKKELTISVQEILLWVGMIFAVIIFAWRILGNSPSLDMLMMAFTIIFTLLAFENRRDTKYLKSATIKQTNIMDDIRKILNEKL